jgi:hypothetical protein
VLVLASGAVLYSCGGGSMDQDSYAWNNANRQAGATADDPFVTEFIAGAGGWNNGGWPEHGTDVGEVSVWNDGTHIYVKFETDDPYYFGGEDGEDNLHLFVGDASGLPGVAPGQFPWSYEVAGNGSSYTFAIPLSGDYPEGGYMDGGSYDFDFGDTVEILAHGVSCYILGPGGGEGGMPAQGQFAVLGLYYGATDIYVGDVTFVMNGWNLEVTVEVDDPWYIHETQFYAGFDEPPFAPGQWPYQQSPLPDWVQSDQYSVSLFDLGAECGDMLLIAFHATLYQDILTDEEGNKTYGWYDGEEFVGAESATAWNDDCREPLVKYNGNKAKPHDWKSYCAVTIPNCVPGEDDEEICETAWGFDLDGDLFNADGSMIGNGLSRDEDGWFPNYYGITRWGCVFEYTVTAPEI